MVSFSGSVIREPWATRVFSRSDTDNDVEELVQGSVDDNSWMSMTACDGILSLPVYWKCKKLCCFGVDIDTAQIVSSTLMVDGNADAG